jgi:hypothetical protein
MIGTLYWSVLEKEVLGVWRRLYGSIIIWGAEAMAITARKREEGSTRSSSDFLIAATTPPPLRRTAQQANNNLHIRATNYLGGASSPNFYATTLMMHSHPLRPKKQSPTPMHPSFQKRLLSLHRHHP